MKSLSSFDFNERPFIAIWETTHACGLACVHCRAKADLNKLPDELTTSEAKKLIEDVAAMKTPVLIFSGGDALQRSDLPELVRHAKSLGLRIGVIPAVTPDLTPRRLEELKNAGVDQLALSLDAADSQTHDDLRQTPGVFERTLQAVGWAHKAKLSVQINSLVNVHNASQFDRLTALIETFPIVFWEIFFLVPTGRGKDLTLLTARAFDEVFEKIYAFQKRAPFVVKVTEAQHYRKFCINREAPHSARNGHLELPEMLRRQSGPDGSVGHAPSGVNSGKGFVFISCTGEIMPSGFLPLAAGNVKKDSIGEIYRNAAVFKALRDVKRLKGKCGRCAFNELCGGSRSRAWALTGDYLAEDPACSYQP